MSEQPSLRVIFAGTPDFAAKHLTALLNSRHEVCAVFTQPDRPAGRGRKTQATPVKAIAEMQNIPVFQPTHLKDAEHEQIITKLQADIMVVVAYGLLIPPSILALPTLGCINVHASLLPRWRGAAPIQRAIATGDKHTGVCIMQMEQGLDTGPVLMRHCCAIEPSDTGGQLHDRLAAMGALALPTALDRLQNGELAPQEQDHTAATYAHKIAKAEAGIDWQQPAETIANQIRAFNPWPVCHTQREEWQCRVWSAHPVEESTLTTPLPEPGTIITNQETLIVACGDGALAITEMQLPGAKRLPIQAILNAKREHFMPGDRFNPL